MHIQQKAHTIYSNRNSPDVDDTVSTRQTITCSCNRKNLYACEKGSSNCPKLRNVAQPITLLHLYMLFFLEVVLVQMLKIYFVNACNRDEGTGSHFVVISNHSPLHPYVWFAVCRCYTTMCNDSPINHSTLE